MARTPGLSVRLKLTLSYVGFLMLTVALLAAAAWVFFLRYIPTQERIVPGSTGSVPATVFPVRSSLQDAFVLKAAAVLEVLVAAEGGVISAEELLERAWDENADPFTNAVRITVSALRKRLGEPRVIATVPGVGYRIDAGAGTQRAGSKGG